MDEVVLEDSLQQSLKVIGANDPFVKAALGGKSSADVAHTVMTTTKLGDPVVRKALVDGGAAAVASSTDPLIILARNVDAVVKSTQVSWRTEVESIEASAGERLG